MRWPYTAPKALRCLDCYPHAPQLLVTVPFPFFSPLVGARDTNILLESRKSVEFGRIWANFYAKPLVYKYRLYTRDVQYL